MKSEHTITVIVTDQNDSPSSPRSVHVIVHSFNAKTPLGKIADVHPNDPDITGIYSCRILQGSNLHVLSIPTACDLHAKKITSGMYLSMKTTGKIYRKLLVECLEIYDISVLNFLIKFLSLLF